MILDQGAQAAREMPRLVTPDVLWTGGCLALTLQGEPVHAHFNNFVVRGDDKVMLIDTGHPIHADEIDAALDGFLGGRPVDYIFPTHVELPHSGLLPKWLAKYPGAVVVGETRDYHLYYPEFADRFRLMGAGDVIDLGGRGIMLVPGVWADLGHTLWAFDTADRILFCADGLSITFHHKPGTSGLATSELPLPDLKMVRILSELALQWTRYTDVAHSFGTLERLLGMLAPRMIAPAHGAVIDDIDRLLPLIREAMDVKSHARAF